MNEEQAGTVSRVQRPADPIGFWRNEAEAYYWIIQHLHIHLLTAPWWRFVYRRVLRTMIENFECGRAHAVEAAKGWEVDLAWRRR